jgi:transketolase
MHPLKRKLESFNFKVYECDGHNISKLKNVLKQMKTYFVKSKILIANTVKGKGIKTIENNPKWHHLSEYIESKHKQILNDGINYYSEKL